METNSKKFNVLLFALIAAAWFGGAGISRAQVTLTVSPSVISNTYQGDITLNITGLTNTEQVQVQRCCFFPGLRVRGCVPFGRCAVERRR